MGLKVVKEDRNRRLSRLRIAFLGHKSVPSRQGGVEIVVEQLAVRMARLGHTVTVYNRSGHHVSGKAFDGKRLQTYKGVRLKYVPTLNIKGIAAMSASFFAAVAAAFGKYDVVHFHAEGPCAMLWLPKLFKKRCIATIHGLDHRRAKWGFVARNYIMLGEKCAAKYADEIIVLSKSVQQYFLDTYGRETHFIENGVSRPTVRKAQIIKEKYGLEKDSYILFLGRLVPEKGLSCLVEAFKGVKTDKKLVIAGGNSDAEDFTAKLKQAAASDNRILFTDFVQGKELDELYSNAYLYTLPSDLEGMPLSLLEAMSYGNCCLTSDIDECASVVEDMGILFKKSDVNDLREKLQQACDNPQSVQNIKAKSQAFILSKYNWNDVTARTLRLYDACGEIEEKRTLALK